MTSSTPLHFYMKSLLQGIREEEDEEEEVDVVGTPASPTASSPAGEALQIICDNAPSPTRTLLIHQRRLDRMRKIHRSYSDQQPSHNQQKERRRKFQQQQKTKSYTFPSPHALRSKQSSVWYPTSDDSDEEQISPTSVALLKIASPRSARWKAKSSSSLSPDSTKFGHHLPHLPISPRSARWSPTPPCFVRQESEKDLVCPKRPTMPHAPKIDC